MAERVRPHDSLTVDEYLKLEESATVRHEYVGGEIFAMVGATKRHNRIIGNISGRLWEAARGGACRVYSESVKLRVSDDVIYYPDVMVACGPEGDDPLVEDDPCLVVEVASPSSETTDRREKLASYKRMPGLRVYLIVAQDRRWVERHFRAEDGMWRRGDLVDEGRFSVPCPGTELSLAEIYEGLE
ncbi:MAG: Uma2 family endonuclease [Rubrobacteraceae bacterium]|nr:Uma2 family endonuclease [Rubrobacteraceae bacterium]